MANFELIFFIGADELACAAASAWLDEIETANRAGKTHCVALSGGRITQKFFAATVEQAASRKISFAHVHFFWADERCVPPTDPDSNFRLANELLFIPLKISETQIHRLRGEISPQAAVTIAEEELCQIASPGKNNQPVLDLVFLGLGEDGHVASLFPNSGMKMLDTFVSFVVIENSPKPPPRRISLGYEALKHADKIWVFASGSGKDGALRESLKPDGRTPLAQVIRLRAGTKIFSDIRMK